MKQRMLGYFEEVFGDAKGAEVYFAPGRVNLIGEHTDYNGGHVLPCALTIGTYGAVRKRKDRRLRLYSVNAAREGIVETSLDDLVPSEKAGWTNYPKGVIWAFEGLGMKMDCGLDLLIYGDIPRGSGLSSSASLEVLTGAILRDLYLFSVKNQMLARFGQYSEQRYNGVNCGIMDQFAVAMGRENQAIFLDTQNLAYEYAPLKLEGYKLVIADTNKRRELIDTRYSERRGECERALGMLMKVIDISNLCDLKVEQFEQYKEAVDDPVLLRRARHVVYENDRTVRALETLKEGRMEEFGRLMNESHLSLRDDYEVTGPELDALAEAAWKTDGVIGSRMTGAGFGGCTVSIVREDAAEGFQESVGRRYREATGLDADFYLVKAGGGPRKL